MYLQNLQSTDKTNKFKLTLISFQSLRNQESRIVSLDFKVSREFDFYFRILLPNFFANLTNNPAWLDHPVDANFRDASPLNRSNEFRCHFFVSFPFSFASRTVQLGIITSGRQRPAGRLPRVCRLDNYSKVIIGFTSSWHRTFCSFSQQYGPKSRTVPRSISVFQLTPSVSWFYPPGKKELSGNCVLSLPSFFFFKSSL